MDEEKLIHLVQAHSCLYDMSSRFYSDRMMKGNAWVLISRELEKPVSECQTQWKKLRDNYRKSLKVRNEKSGAAGGKRRPIKFEKELEFVKPFVLQSKDQQISNLDSSGEDTQNSDMPTASTVRSSSSGCSNYLPSQQKTSQILERYISSKVNEEKHPIDIFFSSMAATVKMLSPRLQVEVKRKVMDIVTDAELKQYDNGATATNEYVPTRIIPTTQIESETDTLHTSSNYRTLSSHNLLDISNTYYSSETTDQEENFDHL